MFEQLSVGVRYLDLMIAYDGGTDDLYCARTVAGPSFQEVAAQVVRFLESSHVEYFLVKYILVKYFLVEMDVDYRSKSGMEYEKTRLILQQESFANFFQCSTSLFRKGR